MTRKLDWAEDKCPACRSQIKPDRMSKRKHREYLCPSTTFTCRSCGETCPTNTRNQHKSRCSGKPKTDQHVVDGSWGCLPDENWNVKTDNIHFDCVSNPSPPLDPAKKRQKKELKEAHSGNDRHITLTAKPLSIWLRARNLINHAVDHQLYLVRYPLATAVYADELALNEQKVITIPVDPPVKAKLKKAISGFGFPIERTHAKLIASFVESGYEDLSLEEGKSKDILKFRLKDGVIVFVQHDMLYIMALTVELITQCVSIWTDTEFAPRCAQWLVVDSDHKHN